MKINQPTTPKSYWELIQIGYARNLVPHSEVSEALFKQIEPLMHDHKEVKTIDLLIQQICDLPFPASLGMVDSREYDTLCAGIIGGLQNVIRQNGGTPATLPANAPQASTNVKRGALSWQQGGSARAHEQWQTRCIQEAKEAQALIDALNSTDACKQALSRAHAGHPIKGLVKNWKRISKETKGDRIFRTFEAAGERALVVFDPSADNPTAALFIPAGLPPISLPGQFPQITGPELTGKVLFGLNVIEDDEVSFYCGPQTNQDRLSDRYDNQAEIKPIIKQILGVRDQDLYCAENFHIVRPLKGETTRELANYLDKTMRAAGAIVEHENDIDL